MKFYPLASPVGEDLTEEYKSAHAVGLIRVGEQRLFFKKGLRVYYIPYEEVGRLFRRVISVPAKLCCGTGEMKIEHLVICGRDDRELAQIQLPDTKAARLLMEQLRTVAPGADFGRPVQI